jgi:8-oxo-dGTP pyrophosphatase MutT (NUDIX family)
MRVVGCFLEHEGKFVVLLRHSHKPDGDTWGLPGGKVEAGEGDVQALLRELEEETGYRAEPAELEHLGDYDFVSPRNDDVAYVTYRVRLKHPHRVVLEDAAHAEYRWVTAKACDAMPDLIHGFHDLLRMVGYIR